MDLPESSQSRRTQRLDGKAGPALRRPWAQWEVLARGDIVASILGAIAIVLTAGSLLWGPPSTRMGNPSAFVWTAPLVAAVFFVAMVAMFVERDRHGVARALFGGGALVLAIAAMLFLGAVPLGRLIAFYWSPAILAVTAGLALSWSKHKSLHEGVEAEARHRRRPD